MVFERNKGRVGLSKWYVCVKCNKKRIIDYTNINRYLQKIKSYPQIQPTINIDHIKTHYYGSHPTINPNGIIPAGPDKY